MRCTTERGILHCVTVIFEDEFLVIIKNHKAKYLRIQIHKRIHNWKSGPKFDIHIYFKWRKLIAQTNFFRLLLMITSRVLWWFLYTRFLYRTNLHMALNSWIRLQKRTSKCRNSDSIRKQHLLSFRCLLFSLTTLLVYSVLCSRQTRFNFTCNKTSVCSNWLSKKPEMNWVTTDKLFAEVIKLCSVFGLQLLTWLKFAFVHSISLSIVYWKSSILKLKLTLKLLFIYLALRKWR